MFLTLESIKDWIKSVFEAEHYYMGKLDNKQNKSIGIYQRKTNNAPRICIGGIDNASYEVKPVSILVHWSNDASETEKAAHELFNNILQGRNVTINNIQIPYIKLLNSEPVDVGTDDKGIYERVIELDIYYSKGE